MAASEIIMIKPCSFSFNPETASSNTFQNSSSTNDNVQEQALIEFNRMVTILEQEGIVVNTYDDTPEPHTPDAVFPNNWLVTHEDGTIVLFPMEARNRRLERREDLINDLEYRYRYSRIIDFTDAENIDVFLEGTGSIVFDHQNRIAYACKSSRTHEQLFKDYCETIDYRSVIFNAHDAQGKSIYHTNVLMHVGHDYVVICLDAIPEEEQKNLSKTIHGTGKALITISFEQMNAFAGNMLQLQGTSGLITVLSQTAFESLSEAQKQKISESSRLVPIAIPTIECIGGGSVRCMMAEIFLKKL